MKICKKWHFCSKKTCKKWHFLLQKVCKKWHFLLYNDDGIIPLEVKSSGNVKSASLNTYMKVNKPQYALRVSTRNFGYENGIKSTPLYAAFCID